MNSEVSQSMVNEMVAQLKRQYFLSLDSQSITRSTIFSELENEQFGQSLFQEVIVHS